MTPKYIMHSSNKSEVILHDKVQQTSTLVDLTGPSKIVNDTSCIISMCPKNIDGHVYKRRKLDIDRAHSQYENASESVTNESFADQSCTTAIGHSPFVQENTRKPPGILSGCNDLLLDGNRSVGLNYEIRQSTERRASDETFLHSVTAEASSEECEGAGEVIEADFCKARIEIQSVVADQYSSSMSSINPIQKDTRDCASYVATEPLIGVASSRELCIRVLKNHHILKGRILRNSPGKAVHVNDDRTFLSCKICGQREDPVKMLICDMCEEAFHLSCCDSGSKSLSHDAWFCQQCSEKNPRSAFGLHCRGGVRIGACFQAKIPEWSGPTCSIDDYFNEPADLDPSEFSVSYDRKGNSKSKPASIGNWIQCREVVALDENDNDIICGKWRRAPLFACQTDGWDCFGAVLWDPLHADCAVPQELETAEVRRHLRFITKVKHQLAEAERMQTPD